MHSASSKPGSHPLTERPSQRPTQRTVADHAGVSVGTVSRALANDPKIKKATRERIQNLAQDLGYSPDRAAQRLRTGRSNVISLVLSPHDEIFGFGTSLIRGISSVLNDTPYHLVVTPDLTTDGSDTVISHVVRNKLADGIIFSRTNPNDQRARYLLEADFPFITHGRTELATPHPFVDYDNFEFAYSSGKKLIARGAHHLAILLPKPDFTFHNHLQHGFMKAVRETGVRHEFLANVTLDSPADAIRCAIAQRFQAATPPDGLILPGETSGLAALAALQDLNLKPGKDVHLIIKQTTGLFDLVRPRTESLLEDLPEAGRNLALLLLRRINKEPAAALNFIQSVQNSPLN